MPSITAYLLAALPLAAAHFELTSPTARGFSDTSAEQFPCGGFNDVSSTRTSVPLSGFPIQLDMGHPVTRLQVNLALGNGDGSYSIVVRPTFEQEGPGDFCIGGTMFSGIEGVEEGTNATLQIVSNFDGDGPGGLYQCADITFTGATLSEQEYSQNCRNDTVRINEATGNANNTDSQAGEAAPSGTAAESAPSASPSTGAAANVGAAGYLMGVLGLVGIAAAL